KIDTETRDPLWVSYVTPTRLAADAVEIFRDLRKPKTALTWNEQAEENADTTAARPLGLRLATAAIAACQARDLDRAVHYTQQSVDLLMRVNSARARTSLRDVAAALSPWAAEKPVRDLIERLGQATVPRAQPAAAL